MVTNPAIDREREVEHFSCRAVFGARPCAARGRARAAPRSRSPFPILLGGHDGLAPLSDETYRAIAHEHKTYLLEDLWEAFRGRSAGARHLLPGVREHAGRDRAPQAGGHDRGARRRRAARAVATAPPTRATAATSTRTWRWPRWTWRCASTWVKAGRDQPAPPLRHRAALGRDPQRARRGAGARPRRRRRLPVRDGRGRRWWTTTAPTSATSASALRKGIEKVISTIGIHEVRGYARLFASIGLKPELTDDLRHARLHGLARRAAPASPSSTPTATSASACWPARTESKPAKTFRFYPKVYKAAVAAANGTGELRRVLARRCASSSSSSRSRCATSST